MAGATLYRVGVVVGSQRSPRVGLQIATFVLEVLRNYQVKTPYSPSQSSSFKTADLSLIDLAEHAPPLFNEPGIPMFATSSSQYTHESTRVWSRLISSYDAFIFVTPEYNNGYPASLKNAIDFLFHEWVGKPVMLVGYGMKGGVNATRQVKEILATFRMKIAEPTINLKFPSDSVGTKAIKGEDLSQYLAVEDARPVLQDSCANQAHIWIEERKLLWKTFQEVVNFLEIEKKSA